jgi:hypothetical protein
MKTIKAACTWGDGPDVMLCSDGFPTFNLSEIRMAHSIYGVIDKWSVCLTIDEARSLASSLLGAASQAEVNQLSAEEYMDMQGQIDGEHECLNFLK